jgi:hypothetical protein
MIKIAVKASASIIPALPPRRQQPDRFQFLIRLLEESNALLALIVLHVVRKAVDVGMPELLARHQFWRASKACELVVRILVSSCSPFWLSVQSGFYNRLKLS